MDLPRTPSFRLDGKRAFVAGASSGIGLACAVALAEAGAHTTLAARSADKLDALAEAFGNKGWSADTAPLDISDLDALSAVLDGRGPFDAVVNSAGLARHRPALETRVEDFDAVMAVNLRAAYFLATGAAAGMEKAGNGGSIITISSQMGHVGGIDRAVYCASKHAVEGFTKAMAVEWGPKKIRINTVCPTFVRTPLTEQTFSRPERVAWLMEKIKLARLGEVEDIMGAVVYLTSDASSLVTGTSMLIDGGWTAE
ncbi:MAG: SDR family oxidoreductase [Pseudomonadota bacterium]